MDGFSTNVIVLAATNRYDILDDALLVVLERKDIMKVQIRRIGGIEKKNSLIKKN